jgi:outer membrane protein
MLKLLLIPLLVAALAPVARADATDETPVLQSPEVLGVAGAEPSPWQLGVALGYGMRSNPLIQSDDIPIFVDVDIAYFGKHFFFDNGDVGLTVSDNEWFTLSFIGRFNSDRVFFGKTNTRIVQVGSGTGTITDVPLKVPDRDYAIEAGAELLAGGNWGRLQLAAFHDVSDTHGGYQLNADYSLGVRRQRWYLEPSIGVSFKSESLNDYYWGVQPDEANALLPEYSAGAGTNVSARLLGSYQVTTEWALTAVVEYERLNVEAAASPLVDEDYVTSFFVGFGYRF